MLLLVVTPDTELVSDLGNTGRDSKEETVEPVGERMPEAAGNLSLLWLRSQLGDMGMGTGLSLLQATAESAVQFCMLILCCRFAE